MNGEQADIQEQAGTETETAKPRVVLPLILFLGTLLTTMVTGVLWQNVNDLQYIFIGLPYALSILFILTCHEFGHFFAARYHGVRTTYPHYIPLVPLPGFGIGFGTLGAVIRIREPITSRKALFDIGVAGPIAGFIASLIILIWGFSHLPGKEFLLGIHPDFDFSLGTSPGVPEGQSLAFGRTLLYELLARTIPSAQAYVPPMTEMYHYPYLLAGWFGLFVTAMNLLPVGQLDGGHITYAMFGQRQTVIARLITVLVLISGLMGMFPVIGFLPGLEDIPAALFSLFPWWNSVFWSGWLIWAILIFTVFRINHPPIGDPEPLSDGRMMLGWLALIMFISSITPVPFLFE